MNTTNPAEQAIFEVARKIDSREARDAYLMQVCGQEPALKQRLGDLLRVYEESKDFLESPPPEYRGAQTIDESINEQRGAQIGPYKLLQQIGEGGFGVVYMAEQLHPVRRKVALKIIKPGADTRSVVARFEAERQALALMDHTNIARVLDAGATETGRPYFVMDLVKGVPITEYCDKNRLDTRERLALFVTVCQGVQHAHQKGVIHRDLKPANIMVTLHDGQPVPKIIDFGVSKAISQQLTEKTLFTAYGQMVGTPQYMSPEQAEMSGLDIDTRSDIYSLGVLLYELLTGKTPLESSRLRTAGYAEMQRMICEEEPPTPSTRLSTLGEELTIIAKHRSVEAKTLRQQIRGDLDWIVMRSLEKERGRRYDSASRLASDIQRFLGDEPVEARPPSTSYKFRKFVHRNKRPVIAALAVSIALVAGVVGTTIGLIRADAEARRANQATDDESQARLTAQRLEDEATREAERFRRLSYLSDMNAALHVWQSDVGRAAKLLRRHLPQSGKEDLRRFEWYYLFGLCQRSLMTPQIECSSVAVAYSPDGKRLAFVELEKMKLLDVESGHVTELLGHEALLNDVTFSPDGEIAAASQAGVILLWDVNAESPRLRLNHGDAVRSVQFSPDGVTLASHSWHSRSAKLWDVKTGRELAELPHKYPVTSVAFSNDGTTVASSDWEGTLVLWNGQTGVEQFSIAGHSGPATFVTFSPTADILASAGADGTVKLWRTAEGKLKLRGLLDGHTGSVEHLAFSPKGETLASSGRDNTVRLWNVATGEELDTFRGTGSATDLAFAADSKTLAAASLDGIKLWDTFQRPAQNVLTGPTGEVCRPVFSPDESTLITCGWDGVVRLWDTSTWEVHKELSHDAAVISAPISPDGKTLATADAEGTIRLWNLKKEGPPVELRGHPGRINCVTFSPDGSMLVSAGWGGPSQDKNGTVRIWDLSSGSEIDNYRYDGHPKAARKAVFSPDGKAVASVSVDGTVRVWQFDTRQERILTRDATDSWSVEFSPDGKKLVVKSWCDAKLWDLATGDALTLTGHTAPLMAVGFLPPDARTIATTSYDGTFRLWDSVTGEPQFTFPNCGTGINGFAATADGKLIALCCRDAAIRLLRASTEADVRAAGWYEE